MGTAGIAALYPENVSTSQVPGHWLLARFGKRVLRPGGVRLTRWMLGEIDIVGDDDDVVEFAPGVGATAELILNADPKSYTGIEPNALVVAALKKNSRATAGSSFRPPRIGRVSLTKAHPSWSARPS